MPSDRKLLRLLDVLDNISAIEDHVAGMTREAFLGDRKTIDAAERCLMRIAEAVTKLGPFLEEKRPDYPWSDVRGFGNYIRHEYDRVEPEQIWVIIMQDLPEMKPVVTKLAKALQEPGAPGYA